MSVPFQSGYLTLGKNKLNVLKAGNGKKIMLAFHGFNTDATIFFPFLKDILNNYTLLSVNLPGHGGSDWTTGLKFTAKDLTAIMERCRVEYNVDKISLAGYSLGGRIALMATFIKPELIDKLLLLAPDGLQPNFWFGFSTNNLIGNLIFKKVIKNPELLIKHFATLEKYKLVNKSVLKLAKNDLEDNNIRQKLATVWTATSHLIPAPHVTRKNIIANRIPTCIIMGSHDRLIPPKNAQKFGKGVPFIKIHVFDTGHNVLTPEAKVITDQFLLNEFVL